MKSKKFEITFPIFADYTVHMTVTSDVVAARKKMDSTIGFKYEGSSEVALHDYNDAGDSWLFFSPNPKAGTVAHESWHCVRRMLKWAGAGLDDEVVAYHLEFLVDEVTKHLLSKGGR